MRKRFPSWSTQFALIVATAWFGCLLLSPSADAAYPGQNGKIAFASNRDGDFEIFTMNSDGTGVIQITHNTTFDGGPRWSPDGTKIAFESHRDANNRVLTMNPDGSNQVVLGSIGGFSPTWSPDGSKIAFSGFPVSGTDIYVINADGSALTNLTNSSSNDWFPAWSPDGTRIAFSSDRGPFFYREIYMIPAIGGAETKMTTVEGSDESANWSPDSQQILFQRSEVDPEAEVVCCPDIMVLPATGGTPQYRVASGFDETSPAWSPDGTKFTFSSWLAGLPAIYTANANGTGVTRITNPNAYSDIDPDWQPLVQPPHETAPYDAPASASPIAVSLVPNYRQTISVTQCQARGGAPSSHGPPLAFSSCQPPGLVAGTVAFFGPGAHASASLTAIEGDTEPSNGDQADLALAASLTDVRTSLGTDYDSGAADATLVARLRLSDTFNGPSTADPGTMVDLNFAAPFDCVATGDPVTGGTCSASTTADAIAPGFILENQNMLIQTFRVRVNDVGPNGSRGDPDDKTFATQGIYIP